MLEGGSEETERWRDGGRMAEGWREGRALRL